MHILAPFLSHHSSHKYSIYSYLSRYHQFTNHASVTLLSSFLLHLLFHFYLPPSLILPSVLPHPLNLPLSLLPSSLHFATIPPPPYPSSILFFHSYSPSFHPLHPFLLHTRQCTGLYLQMNIWSNPMIFQFQRVLLSVGWSLVHQLAASGLHRSPPLILPDNGAPTVT